MVWSDQECPRERASPLRCNFSKNSDVSKSGWKSMKSYASNRQQAIPHQRLLDFNHQPPERIILQDSFPVGLNPIPTFGDKSQNSLRRIIRYLKAITLDSIAGSGFKS